MNKQNLENLKLLADQEKGQTVTELLMQDQEYDEIMQKFVIAEKLFNDLYLSDNQKSIVLEYMQQWDTLQMEYATYSYLAGIKNADNSRCSLKNLN